MPQIGPTFSSEISAAGLAGLPFAWDTETGAITYDPAITPAQQDAIEAVKAAHDPNKPLIPTITKRQMLLWLLANQSKTEADVLAAIGTIADATARGQAQIEWSYPGRGLLHRAHPLFDQLGGTFGMNAADIDAAFIAAALL